MVESGASCRDIIHQINAVQAALGAVRCLLIEEEIQTSLRVFLNNGSSQDRDQELEHLVSLYKMVSK